MAAKTFRTTSNRPVYVARLERGVRPIGRWSTETSRSTPARSSVISPTRVDFPEPDTPVTAVSTPSGNRAVTPRRLCRVTGPTVTEPRGARTSRPGAGERSKR
ncbi:hypothetical protein SVIOM342S_04538 [Streptomyces violaceorubidus]